jgi:hypothetical protein
MVWLRAVYTFKTSSLFNLYIFGLLNMLFLINEIVAFIFGLFFNITLLFLIQSRTPDLMRPYAVILRIRAIPDTMFDVVTFITSTVGSIIPNSSKFCITRTFLFH